MTGTDELATDPRTTAILAFAEKVTRAAHDCTPADLDALRAVGLSDEDVFDVAEDSCDDLARPGADWRDVDRALSRLGQVAAAAQQFNAERARLPQVWASVPLLERRVPIRRSAILAAAAVVALLIIAIPPTV